MNTNTNHKGGRKRTGGLLFKSGQWYARVTAMVDGEPCRTRRTEQPSHWGAGVTDSISLLTAIRSPDPAW
jgi:hypothetical protein